MGDKGKVIVSITMSLDGYVAGKEISQQNPMGVNGQLLHNWLFSDSQPEDEKIITSIMNSCGAVIMGSTTYKTAVNGVWEGRSPFSSPVFVLSSGNLPVIEGFNLANSGIENALTQARAIAKDKHVLIMGGANVVQQYLYAGLLDELNIQIAPIILGGGTRLFLNAGTDKIDLVNVRTVQTKGATHLLLRPSKKSGERI